jgi:hypothetical protein
MKREERKVVVGGGFVFEREMAKERERVWSHLHIYRKVFRNAYESCQKKKANMGFGSSNSEPIMPLSYAHWRQIRRKRPKMVKNGRK